MQLTLYDVSTQALSYRELSLPLNDVIARADSSIAKVLL